MNVLSLFKRKYYPLNTIEISTQALRDNYDYLSKFDSELSIAPVLKSNAYGHGLQLVGKILDNVGAPFLCVDSLYEAYELKKVNIKTPILIMGYVHPKNLKTRELPFTYAVYDKEQVLAISKYQKQSSIHIFVDTGMHREGINIEELPDFLKFVKDLKNIRVDGLMSHLGAADQNLMTEKQLENFNKAKEMISTAGFNPTWFHIAASGGLLHSKEYKKKMGNLARCGISIYGIDPEGKDKNLRPVLELKTTLNQIKYIKKDERIGYDFTYNAKKNMTIGILPLGYFDGVDRRLSNKGFVSINNTLCPIIGRVSMNLTTIDITEVKNPQVGDVVTVYSKVISNKNSIYSSSDLSGTIPYDLLIRLATSTKRIVV